MTSYHMRHSLQITCIESIGVIANVDDLRPVDCLPELAREDEELVRIAEPLPQAVMGGSEPSHEGFRPNHADLMPGLTEAATHQAAEVMHARVVIVRIIPDKQHSHRGPRRWSPLHWVGEESVGAFVVINLGPI